MTYEVLNIQLHENHQVILLMSWLEALYGVQRMDATILGYLK